MPAFPIHSARSKPALPEVAGPPEMRIPLGDKLTSLSRLQRECRLPRGLSRDFAILRDYTQRRAEWMREVADLAGNGGGDNSVTSD